MKMKAKSQLFLAMSLAVGLAFAVLVTVSGRPAQAQVTCDRYVLGIDASDTSDCSDEEHPCRTVQYAIDQAVDGDAICVAKHSLAGPLTYPETLVITKSVTLNGAWDAMCVDPSDLRCSFTAIPCDPANVTLHAEGAGRVISITGDITPVIDCFTITGGDAEGLGGDPDGNQAGGGIYSRDAAPIIINNVITANYGCQTCTISYGRGGGVYLLNAPATAIISDNLIVNNVADETTWGQGGGIMLRDSDAQVLSNTVRHNRAGHSAGDGGGIIVRGGTPHIADNDILYNRAGQAVMGNGGGIFVWSSTPVTIEGNRLEYNHAILGSGDSNLTSHGGGIAVSGNPTMAAVIRDNVVRHNIASPFPSHFGEGGGIYLHGLTASSVVSGNVLESNMGGHDSDGTGGGIHVGESTVTLEGNYLFDNSATWSGSSGRGGGIYVEGSSVVIHSNVITQNHGAGFPGFPSTATGYGGGVAIRGSQARVVDNRIVENDGTNGNGLGEGGGVYVDSGTVRIQGNVISANRASPADLGWGGGLYLDRADTWMEGNVIFGNKGADGNNGRGGGVRLWRCSPYTLTNNIIAHNDASAGGSGVAIAMGTGRLAHNTIAENRTGDGVGVWVDPNPSTEVTLYNNIIVSHTVGITNTDPASSPITATHTLFQGNGTNYGAGVTSGSEIPGPAALLADYHLDGGSNAIDHGIALSWVTIDIDGDPRPIGSAPDVGADEVWTKAFLPLVLRGF